MNRADVARLLTYCAAMDNRKITEDTVEAWYATIGDLDLDDALAAAREHYRNGSTYLEAKHIVRGVHAIRSKRLAGWVDPLPAADPSDVAGYLAEIRHTRDLAASGKDHRPTLEVPAGNTNTPIEGMEQ